MDQPMTVAPPPIPAPPEATNGVVDLTKTGQVPARVTAEFRGPQALDPVAKAELDALERDIERQLAGQSPVAPPAPAAPLQIPLGTPPVAAAPVVPAAPAVPPAPATPQPIAPVPAAAVPTPSPVPAPVVGVNDFLNADAELARLRGTPTVLPPGIPPAPQPAPAPHIPAQNPWAPAGSPVLPALDPQFEARLHADLQRDPVGTIVNMQRAAIMAANERNAQQVKHINMQIELMQIAQKDPTVFTAEGLAELKAVRAANPWLDASGAPWTYAYKLSGRESRVAASPQATAPAGTAVPSLPPTGRPAAPVVPGGAATPMTPVPAAVSPTLTNEAQLRQHLQTKFPNDPKAQSDYLEAAMRRAIEAAGVAR